MVHVNMQEMAISYVSSKLAASFQIFVPAKDTTEKNKHLLLGV
jgi:hypothetical protein